VVFAVHWSKSNEKPRELAILTFGAEFSNEIEELANIMASRAWLFYKLER
jgi:hypothetical protein